MARPFDDSLSYHQTTSSMSSQTSLAGDRAWKLSSTEGTYPTSLSYDEAGQSSSIGRIGNNASWKGQRPKLPKIKSSPSHGALAVARANHAKLHKRGNSAASSTKSPTSPTFVPDYLLQTSSSAVPASAHANPYSMPESKASSKTKAKIKPFMRKFSSQENVSIDLSRSAAENEGLGIYTSSEISGTPAGPEVNSGRRGYHHRATSAASQLSNTTSSSNHRYGTPYMHPMRQTPRPFTPPLTNSYKTSLESEVPTATSSGEVPHDSHSRQTSSTAPTPYAPLPSSRRPPPLHVRTGSASRLTSSSQTNLPGTPSSLRFNNIDTISPADMVSPKSARSSFDSVFSKKRSRSNTTTTDPAAQAAKLQALRQQFQEKEAAKDLKYQQAEARAQEKEARKKDKREESDRRTSEKKERNRTKSNAASEKSSFLTLGDQHEVFPTVQMLPHEAPLAAGQYHRRRKETAGSAGKAASSKWSLFWFRFKTMWLRFKRTMSKSSSEV
ncbi:hypothetical protein MMC28_002394 [Mycoblastus sanguinarius]|nr:hypothetical protein [Mycoblastus sanguinarius]